MAGVRANWHLSALDIPEGQDPFDIAEAGAVIDLTGEIPRIVTELEALQRRESHWRRKGVTCPLKERSDWSCLDCSQATDAADDPLHFLCRIGKDQERAWGRAEELSAVKAEADELIEAAGVVQALEHAEAAGMPGLVELAEALA